MFQGKGRHICVENKDTHSNGPPFEKEKLILKSTSTSMPWFGRKLSLIEFNYIFWVNMYFMVVHTPACPQNQGLSKWFYLACIAHFLWALIGVSALPALSHSICTVNLCGRFKCASLFTKKKLGPERLAFQVKVKIQCMTFWFQNLNL